MKLQAIINCMLARAMSLLLARHSTGHLIRLPLIAIFLFSYITVKGQLPIHHERTIKFKTTESSYMDVDVSPDGQYILFTLLGDIYKVPATGGKAKRLTRGLAVNYQPVWSPDGKSFAYISDKSGSYQIHIFSNQGAQDKKLTSIPKGIETLSRPIKWEGKNQIKFDKQIYDLRTSRVWADTSVVKVFPDHPYLDLMRFTPDGKLAVISSGHPWYNFTLINQKTGTKRMLESALLETDKNYLGTSPTDHFGVSFDSKYVFAGYGGKIHKITLATGDDKIIPFEANVKVDLGKFNQHQFDVSQETFKTNYVRSARKSPNQKQIVYSAMNKIYVKDLPNGVPRKLLKQDNNQYQPTYSPDGKWIAYVTWDDKDGGALWKIFNDGSKIEMLASSKGQFQCPAWSPNGRSIAVLRDPMSPDQHRDYVGYADLILVDIETKKVRTIDTQVPLWNKLDFHENGKTIIYTGKDLTGLQSKLVQGDTAKTVIAEGTFENFRRPKFFMRRSLSQDGGYFLYELNEDIYLVENDRLQKPMRLFDKDHKLTTIHVGSGVDPHWSSDGSKICWNYGSIYYESSLKTILKKGVPEESIELGFGVEMSKGLGYLALTHVRLLTMNLAGQMINDGTILIKDGRIFKVGKTEEVEIPFDARTINLTGKTIIPGLIDLHDHMYLQENVFLEQSWIYQSNLAYGVTTACDPSASYSSFGYADLLRSGSMVGPRLFSSGRSTNPEFNFNLTNRSDGFDIALKRKLMAGTLVKQYNLPSRLQRQWLLLGAEKAGLNMTNETRQPIDHIAMIKDGTFRIEHNSSWGNIYSDFLQFYAKSGTILTPALQLSYGTDRYGLFYFRRTYWNHPDEKLRRFCSDEKIKELEEIIDTTGLMGFLTPARINSRMYKAGAKIGLGSHGNDPGIGAHNEMWALQMGGLTNMEVLRIATVEGAQALGVERDLGSLEVGKIADLIILNKNPLEDIHNTREISYVMKDGILYDGNTLDTLWPFQRKCPNWRPNPTRDNQKDY